MSRLGPRNVFFPVDQIFMKGVRGFSPRSHLGGSGAHRCNVEKDLSLSCSPGGSAFGGLGDVSHLRTLTSELDMVKGRPYRPTAAA